MNPIILSIPFLLASIASVILKSKRGVRNSNLILSLIGGGAIFYYALPFVFHLKEKVVSNWWLIDSFSALIASMVAFVFMASLVVGIRYIGHEYDEGDITLYQYKLYFALYQIFSLSMILLVLTNNTLFLWLALEGTTLFSTFLVGLYRKKTSIEAAWKYMIVCTTGISLGLVGILLLGYGAHMSGMSGNTIFLISSLMESAGAIPDNIIKLSFIFLFIGVGTKVGLAPMHTWLPDAHSKAPSPISAIFSAVLLNVALYVILRFKYIADVSFAGTAWTGNLFLVFGAFSVFLSAFMMLIQENYKRMLAYSSIEHMGLILFSLALSPIGAAFAVMHMIGHALIKSALFFGAGEILLKYKTTKIPKIKDMLARAKHTSVLFIVSILMIIAVPPSMLFISEYGMFSQAIIGYPKTALMLFVALGIIAYAMLQLTMTMIFSKSETIEADLMPERWSLTHTIIVAELAISVSLMLWFATDHGLAAINAIVKDFTFIN